MADDTYTTALTAVRTGHEVTFTLASGEFSFDLVEDELAGRYEMLLRLVSEIIDAAKARYEVTA